jgi:hypothetical protein
MRRDVLTAALALPLGVLGLIRPPAFAAVDLNFDAAYMVAASGSTEPVSVFDINGPAPWLYLDLPDGALSSFLVDASSNWFHEGESTQRFSLANDSFTALDKFWFSPSPEAWESAKAAGEWHIDARHALVNLILIYGVGVGQVWATGSTTTDFTVGSGMPGDFNGDYNVDAMDYVVWRQTDGTPASYDVWRTNFSQTTGGSPLGSFSNSAVPEPSIPVVILSGLLLTFLRRPERAS